MTRKLKMVLRTNLEEGKRLEEENMAHSVRCFS